jgi:E3 ubiquitin-protein ligase ATL6/9/15/31/42/55
MGRSNGRRLRLVLVAAALAGTALDAVKAQQGPPTGPGPSYFDHKNFNPSMAIVMVVLVTAFFLLGFFSIYLRRSVGSPLGGPDDDGYNRAGGRGRPGVPGGIAHASRSSRRAPRGLDRDVLESFLTMVYADVKAHKAGKGALECAVCLSEFDDDETLRLLPRCAHVFHSDCIDAWLASHVTCPVCRAVLAPNYYEAPAAPPLPPASAVSAADQDAPTVPPRQPAPETATVPEQGTAAVVVVVDAKETEEERIRKEEAVELMRIGSVKRALRSKSCRQPAQFPRSHTMGHSLAVAAPAAATEASERYTLRLPERVLRQVLAASSLGRSASVQASSSGSARRGFGGTHAARLPAWGSLRRGEADAPGKGAKVTDDGSKAEQQCDSGACPLGAHV